MGLQTDHSMEAESCYHGVISLPSECYIELNGCSALICNPCLQIFAQIDNVSSVALYDDILDVADGIMISRIRMGMRLPSHKVGLLHSFLSYFDGICSQDVVQLMVCLQSFHLKGNLLYHGFYATILQPYHCRFAWLRSGWSPKPTCKPSQ